MTDRPQLEAAIAALEAQRGLLGDTVVDTALGPLREQLARLVAPAADAATGQSLKQVAVLFLDVVGSTALSQHLDPEDVHAVMDGALARCTRIVVEHDGRVLQYAGDNLLAAFGTGQAGEDDGERAVRCALALLAEGRALRERVRALHGHDGCDVRVGVHTGPVLLGGGVDEEGTIRGLTVNIAARMEQTAPPGGLRISHDTWLTVRDLFEVEPQPPLTVKGRDEPLRTYLVQRARPRAASVEVRGIDGRATPLIGREAERAQLLELLDATAETRRLHAVTLVGEPGIGKSRLLHELQQALKLKAQRFLLLRVQSHPQARLQPYGLLRDLLAGRLEIADSDTREVAKAKLVEGLTATAGPDETAGAHRIGQLIGLDFADSPHVAGLEPPQLRRLAFADLQRHLRGLADEGSALALMAEDLQWADEGSLDFLDQLAREGEALPLALVATARPGLLERRPGWGEGWPRHQRMAMATLDTSQGHALANALLGSLADGAPALRELLVHRAGGNPFFMEELVRMFIDDGVIEPASGDEAGRWRLVPARLKATRIPTTLVGVLQARLDALPSADRLALQQASIVGHVFWDDALAALDPRALSALSALQGRHLIERRAASAFEGTAEEVFNHHLLQQVTYDTVLKPARRAGHAAAARWLAARTTGRSAEYLAITAEHCDRAGDQARALEYFERAAADASARFVNQAALDYLSRALQSPVLTDLRHRERLLTLRENLADLVGQRALQDEALAERERIAEVLDDDALRASTLSSRAILCSRRGDERAAFDLAGRALALATRSQAHETACLVNGQMAFALFSRGELDRARAHAQAALDLARAAARPGADAGRKGWQLLEVQTLTMLNIIESAAGRHTQARACAAQGLALADSHGMRRSRAHLLQTIGLLEMSVGRYELAIAGFQASVEQSLAMGWNAMAATGEYNIAVCHHNLGRHELAIRHNEIAAAALARVEQAEQLLRSILLRGILAAEVGHAQAARESYEQALRLAAEQDDRASLRQARARLAALHLALGETGLALDGAQQLAAEMTADLGPDSSEFAHFPAVLCHRVWAATGDPRGPAHIRAMHAALMAEAARLDDESARRDLLEKVPLHREIVLAYQANGGG